MADTSHVRLGTIAEILPCVPNVGVRDLTTTGYPLFTAGGVAGFYAPPKHSGDAIILSSIGAQCGKCFWAEGQWTAGANTVAIFPNEKVWGKYLFHYLNGLRPWPIQGSGQPYIGAANAKDALVYVPVIPEQKRIACVLDLWDDAIDVASRVVAGKRARLDWIRDQVLSGRKRLPGYNNSWRVVRLADVVHEHGLRSDGSEPVFSVSVHKGLVDQVKHLGRSFSAADTGNYNRVLPGDIVYTKSPTGSFPLGIIKQSKIDHDVIVSPLYGVFTPKTPELGVVLDAYFSSPKATEKYLTPLVQKGAKNTIAVTNKQFLQGAILIPDDECEVVALAKMIETSLEEISVAESEVRLIRHQRRGLMQLLLNGKLRVPASIDALLPDAQPELVAAE